MARRLTIQEQRAARGHLEEAERSLRIYLDPDNDHCSVPADVRETSRLYLDTWVMQEIERVLATLNNALEDS